MLVDPWYYVYKKVKEMKRREALKVICFLYDRVGERKEEGKQESVVERESCLIESVKTAIANYAFHEGARWEPLLSCNHPTKQNFRAP